MRRLVAAALAVAAVLAAAEPARATHTNQTDANDVRGLLDLQSVVFRHDLSPWVWVFRTYSTWTAKRIWDRGFLIVELDTFGSDAVDYVAVVRSNGRGMLGDLFRRRKNGDEIHLRGLRAWRAGSRGAGFRLPRSALKYGASRTAFGWRVLSSYTGARCRTTCIDRVPDDGSMVPQDLA